MSATAVRRRPLGNPASTFSTAGQPGAREIKRRARRRERHKLRHSLRDVTRVDRARKCGYVSTGSGGPGLRLTVDPAGGNVAGLCGLMTCGSVWVCPVCSAKIAARRADELADVMRFALGRKCKATMVTLTMRHHEGQRLKDCWDTLGKGWNAVTSGRQWVDDSAAFGLRGWVKAVEVTRGKSGWHVHVHALMIWDRPVTEQVARHVADRMWARWNRALVKRGFDSLRDSGGLDVRMASLLPEARYGLHEYFVKLAHEVTGGQAKLAKGGGRTPFQILSDAIGSGAVGELHETGAASDDLLAWWEWEKASHGRRQIAWSKGLRKWAGLDAEAADDEVAAEELEGDDLLFLDSDSWRWLRIDPGQVCALLETTEDNGYQAAAAWLRQRGYGYVLLKRRTPARLAAIA